MIQKPSSKTTYWRSIEEVNPGFAQEVDDARLSEVIDHDFGAAAPSDGVSRRRWLQLMGASMAFGSMVGCRMGEEVIAPFAFRPQNRLPGVPEQYATCVDFGGAARPLLATLYDGRPDQAGWQSRSSRGLCGVGFFHAGDDPGSLRSRSQSFARPQGG